MLAESLPVIPPAPKVHPKDFPAIRHLYLLTLGPWTMVPPPAPTWREFFVSQGIPHQTEADAEKIWSHHCIGPEAYDKTMSERYKSRATPRKDRTLS